MESLNKKKSHEEERIKMQNLKITFHMGMPISMNGEKVSTISPVILDRTTTIDGIILASYYAFLKSKGQVLPFDKDHKTVDFIEKKDGVFSGSVWYIDKDADITFDFETFVKKPEYRKIYDATKKLAKKNSAFKAYLGTDETMLVDKIHFYIRAKKEIVEKLLKGKVFAIGKKQSIGFGAVKNIEVEEISKDKGFILNDSTPSKPLPVKDFDVKTKKIAQMRRMPPYWLEEDLEPCYMPTTALYETEDNSSQVKDFSYSICDYQHNCDFLYINSKEELISFRDVPVEKILKIASTRGSVSSWVTKNSSKKCAITNNVAQEGIDRNIRFVIKRLKKSFADYSYFKNNDFLSKEALWCIENLSELAYSYVDKNSWVYLQGKNAQDGSRYKDFLNNPIMLNPPFSINLKDTQNAQHVSFKGKVSISNAYFCVQYGDSQLYIDNEMLQEAIKDINKIISEKEITKSHLCGIFDKGKSFHVPLKKKNNNMKNQKIIYDFQKRYNSHIRFLLSSVKLD